MHHAHHDDFREDLREQVADLSHQVSHLRKQMARRGRSGLQETRHMGEEVADTLRDYYETLPDFRHGAKRLQKSAEGHPATTAAVAAASIIVLGCAISLLRRR